MSVFFRICPEDQHTCADRACLKAQAEGVCSKAASFAHNQPAARAPADTGGPTSPGSGSQSAPQPGRSWDDMGDYC